MKLHVDLFGKIHHVCVTEQVNLSFLKPSKEEIYEHKAVNPYAVEDVCIRVDIDKKMGVFIVDLQG